MGAWQRGLGKSALEPNRKTVQLQEQCWRRVARTNLELRVDVIRRLAQLLLQRLDLCDRHDGEEKSFCSSKHLMRRFLKIHILYFWYRFAWYRFHVPHES